MSTARVTPRIPATRPAPASRPARRRLWAVPASAAPRPRVPFAALVVTLLAAGLVGLLLLNTSMQRGAFELAALQERAEDLTIERQALELKVDRLVAPEHLSRRAAELGMVPNTSPAFLDLATGRVVGDPTPAVPGPRSGR